MIKSIHNNINQLKTILSGNSSFPGKNLLDVNLSFGTNKIIINITLFHSSYCLRGYKQFIIYLLGLLLPLLNVGCLLRDCTLSSSQSLLLSPSNKVLKFLSISINNRQLCYFSMIYIILCKWQIFKTNKKATYCLLTNLYVVAFVFSL